MTSNDLHEIARFDDRLSFLYVEHVRIDQEDKAIALHDESGVTQVPAACLSLLMLGPGTRVTHAAIKTLAESNCLVAWVGEQGVRMYAHGTGGTRNAAALLKQAALVIDDQSRIAVVRRMYLRRFPKPLAPGLTLQQIRGMEGIRVRESYAQASRRTGVVWQGRSYKRGDWSQADPINRALSTANACLYGLVHAAILSAGYSPALGFIHTGKQLSFVYDIADLYKADLTIPLAFDIAASGDTDIARRVRLACRDRFREDRLLSRIIPDIANVLDIQTEDGATAFDSDPAAPGALWDPHSTGEMKGGVNYGPDDPGESNTQPAR